MQINKNIVFAIVSSALIAGCTITPGQDMSMGEKNVAETTSEEDFNSQVDVYPLTPSVLNNMRTIEAYAQSNRALDSQIADYEYRIGPADILNITVWDHPELTIPAGSYRSASESGNWVHSNGTIYYPYIGFVKVTGKTVTEVREELTTRLARFIERPQVDVNVAAFRSQKTYITGEVNKPGQQPITNVPMTLLDAINQAGGISENADWRNVTITHNGVGEKISLYDLMQKGDLTQNRLLAPGDIVHVPRNDGLKVFVMGEVKLPQTLVIDRAGLSLTEALSNAGGLDQMQADATGVFVIRNNRQQDPKSEKIATIYQLDVSDSTAMVLGTEFDMQPYDILYVTAAPISRWNRLMTNLLPTINGFNSLTGSAYDISRL